MLKIAISGATGLIGTALTDHFKAQGASITAIVRTPSAQQFDRVITWDVDKEEINTFELEGHDIFIHLAGANIAGARWNQANKKAIYDSRIKSTRLLAEALLKLERPPQLLICASATGYYGNHPVNIALDESSPVGHDFLAHVCKDWEKEAMSVAKIMRVVNLRTGPVLSPKGGVLAKMLPPFKLGLGGKVGSGEQIFSWITLNEIPRIITHIISNQRLSGPVNVVSPNPVSNEEFTKSLGRAIHRPTLIPMPETAVKILFGEMGESLLLGGARVYPQCLLESGYQFQFPHLDTTLRFLLKN